MKLDSDIRSPSTTRLEREIARALDGETSGHDTHHALRVRNLGVYLAGQIGADAEIVEAAALLHDIGHVSGRDDHARRGAELAGEVLRRSGFATEKLEAVVHCVAFHHWQRDNAGDPTSPSLEYQAFADADRLDALGAIGIARVFAFGGSHNRPIWDPSSGEASSVQHFYDKLLELERGMYTLAGRQLASKRTATLREFLEAFFAEWDLQDRPAGHQRQDPMALA